MKKMIILLTIIPLALSGCDDPFGLFKDKLTRKCNGKGGDIQVENGVVKCNIPGDPFPG